MIITPSKEKATVEYLIDKWRKLPEELKQKIANGCQNVMYWIKEGKIIKA